jgi:hypothetical protein
MADDTINELARIMAARMPVSAAERELIHHRSKKQIRPSVAVSAAHDPTRRSNGDVSKALVDILTRSGR